MKLFVFPGNIEPEILALGAQDVCYARTSGFGELVKFCHHQLRQLLDAPDAELLSFTASGTGAAEALVANWGSAWRSVLVIHGGTFGQRWLHMARRFGLTCAGVELMEGQPPDWGQIQEALDRHRPETVVAVHHETSTGELLDLARLGALCTERAIRLVVDAIGSFLADDFSMSRWGVAAAFISTQKGLCLPPGLSFLAIRPQLGPAVATPASFYFDVQAHRESFQRGQPPWSPAAQIYVQLARRLEKLGGGGAAQVTSVAVKARRFRAEAARLAGWAGFPSRPSNCLTALRFDQPAHALVAGLAAEGLFVMPSADPRLVRVAHLGHASLEDHDDLLARMLQLAGTLNLGTPRVPER